jgi:hypothetical protein
MDLVVKRSLTVPLEGEHQEWQWNYRVCFHVRAISLNPDSKKHYQVGQNRGKDYSVVEHPPKHTPGFGLGDEDVEQQVFLQVYVKREIQSTRYNA